MLDKFLRNGHVSNFRSMYPGERCLEEKRYHFLLSSSRSRAAQEVALWKETGHYEKDPLTVQITTWRNSRGYCELIHAPHLFYLSSILLLDMGDRKTFFFSLCEFIEKYVRLVKEFLWQFSWEVKLFLLYLVKEIRISIICLSSRCGFFNQAFKLYF